MLVTTGRWAQYDANLGVSEPTGDFIWLDQSGNGHTLFQAGIGSPELLDNEINGNDAVSSYGVSGCILSTGGNVPNINVAGSVFLVAKQSKVNGATSSDTNGVFVFSCAPSSAPTIKLSRNSTNNGASGAIHSSALASSADATIPEDTFVTLVLQYTGSTNRIRVNGVEVANVASVSNTYTAAVFDMFGSALGNPGNKVIAFCAVYEQQLSTDEILQNELYLRNRYNHY